MTAAPPPSPDRQAVGRVVAALYEETDIACPTLAHPIAPLGPVLERLPLRREEMPGLTSRKVQAELIRRRAIRNANDFAEVSDDPLAGFLYACGSFTWIFVACGEDQPIARKRFSVAHELGHYLLHFRPQLAQAQRSDVQERIPNWRDEFKINDAETAGNSRAEPARNNRTESAGSPGAANASEANYARCEREANLFAAEMLMPEAVVRDLWTHWRGRLQAKDLASRLAETLLVSQKAMSIRLQTLGLR